MQTYEFFCFALNFSVGIFSVLFGEVTVIILFSRFCSNPVKSVAIRAQDYVVQQVIRGPSFDCFHQSTTPAVFYNIRSTW